MKVYVVFNSGQEHPSNVPAAPGVGFSARKSAIYFIRHALKEEWKIDTEGMSDEQVEKLAWDNDAQRYWHLGEMRVDE